ncbi:hypothetical protein [Streptomyces griseorubiginosus]|uniref:hypothetical protein n=1 Tax=Streptomyces griseorubiginosus TaxID=67304 RepID=UPI0036E89C41
MSAASHWSPFVAPGVVAVSSSGVPSSDGAAGASSVTTTTVLPASTSLPAAGGQVKK